MVLEGKEVKTLPTTTVGQVVWMGVSAANDFVVNMDEEGCLERRRREGRKE